MHGALRARGFAGAGGPLHFCEVGFNAGFSAAVALASDPAVRVSSFDTGENVAVAVAAAHLKAAYGDARLQIFLGFSKNTVPLVARAGGAGGAGGRWDDAPCDVAFIDGGHEYTSVRADLANLAAASRPGAVVLVDDVAPGDASMRGVVRAWREAARAGGRVVLVAAAGDGCRDGLCVGHFAADHGSTSVSSE